MEAYEIHLSQIGSITPDLIKANLRRTTQTAPTPSPGQVLVRIKAVSLNRRDLRIISGDPNFPVPTTNGIVPAAEGAGIVQESTVPEWKAGERVLILPNASWGEGQDVDAFDLSKGLGAGGADGTLRQYAAFEAKQLVPAPAHLSFEQAAAVPTTYGTAWNALFCGPRALREGDWALVEGTGGVSVTALQVSVFRGSRRSSGLHSGRQLAKAAGVNVFATSSSEEKRKLLEEMGATATANYKTSLAWSEEVLGATGRRGVDLVVDVGGQSTIVQALRSTKKGGHVSIVGNLSTSQTDDLIREILFGSKTGELLHLFSVNLPG